LSSSEHYIVSNNIIIMCDVDHCKLFS